MTFRSGAPYLGPAEFAEIAFVTVCFQGNVAAVEAAVDRGAAAAERVGELVSVHVIARLHEDLDLFAGDGGAPVEAQPAAGFLDTAVNTS